MSAGATDVAQWGPSEAGIWGRMNGASALKAEWLEHTSGVVDAQGVVAPEFAELVKYVERQVPFICVSGLGVPDLILLADIPDDCLYFSFDDDMASVYDRCVCNDAV